MATTCGGGSAAPSVKQREKAGVHQLEDLRRTDNHHRRNPQRTRPSPQSSWRGYSTVGGSPHALLVHVLVPALPLPLPWLCLGWRWLTLGRFSTLNVGHWNTTHQTDKEVPACSAWLAELPQGCQIQAGGCWISCWRLARLILVLMKCSTPLPFPLPPKKALL